MRRRLGELKEVRERKARRYSSPMRLLLVLTLFAIPLWPAGHRQQLLDADRAFARDTAARGLDGWMSWFASDAQVNHRTGLINGTAALREHFGKAIGQPGVTVTWEPFFAEASRDGTLGYTMGVAEWTTKSADGKVEKRPGRYVTVWRKMKDGTWKVVTDIGN